MKKNLSMVVGITGGLATGKTTVTKMFGALGAVTVDADAIVHDLLHKASPCRRRIVKVFGPQVQGPKGIDRRALAKIVFGDVKKLRRLENIIHPYVARAIREKIVSFRKQRKRKLLAVEVPLLFEAGFHHLMDKAVVVYADKKAQIKRARQLKSLSRTDALKRMNAQMALSQKVLLADFIVDNSGSLLATRQQVRDIYTRLVKK